MAPPPFAVARIVKNFRDMRKMEFGGSLERAQGYYAEPIGSGIQQDVLKH
jgi:hypothetical protein